jgi:hypothetical protein
MQREGGSNTIARVATVGGGLNEMHERIAEFRANGACCRADSIRSGRPRTGLVKQYSSFAAPVIWARLDESNRIG